MASGPQAQPLGGTLGEASPPCEAVLHMHGQLGIPATHRTFGDMVGDTAPEPAVELAIDEGVDVTAVAEVVDAQHAGGNPLPDRLLPAE